MESVIVYGIVYSIVQQLITYMLCIKVLFERSLTEAYP